MSFAVLLSALELGAVSLGLLVVALRLAVAFPMQRLSIIMVLVYCGLLGVSLAANFFEVSPGLFHATLFVVVICMWVTLPRLGSIGSRRTELNEIILGLLLVTAIQYIPLIFALPPGTLIVGNFICNDSVLHGVLTLGAAFNRGASLPVYYTDEYPQGLHSLVFYLRPLFGWSEAPKYLLASNLWAFSMIVPAMLYFCDSMQVQGMLRRVLIAVVPACSFLLGMTGYLLFISQHAVIPVLLLSLLYINRLLDGQSQLESLGGALSLLVGCIVLYGVFPVSVVVSLVGLRLLLASLKGSLLGTLSTLRNLVRASLKDRGEILFLSLVLVAGVVPISSIVRMVVRQIEGGIASDLTSSTGNLPDGFLSPLLVTGLWHPNLGYREHLGMEYPYWLAALIIILALQTLAVGVWLRRSPVILVVSALLIPVLASRFIVVNQYINFKYLSFLAAFWLPVSMVAFERGLRCFITNRCVESIVTPALLSCVALGTALFPLQAYKLIPALPDHWFKSLEEIRESYLVNSAVLILSEEDWFHYYKFGGNDLVPFALYLHREYRGEKVDLVIVDIAYEERATRFIEGISPDASNRLSHCSRTRIGGRFDVYQSQCLLGGI
ncbi:MAG: hypothetical protein EBZ48_11980 [Proteobacteria bacterium]|nr:hypothetical protein [Pseudomonadota bacterium]